jgi:hypothetical protein
MIVLIQYIPRVFLIVSLNSKIVKASGVVTRTAWAGAAYNLLLYTLASHVCDPLKFPPFVVFTSQQQIECLCFDYSNPLLSPLSEEEKKRDIMVSISVQLNQVFHPLVNGLGTE